MALNVKHFYHFELPDGKYTRRREIPFRSFGEVDYIGDFVMNEENYKQIVFTSDFEEEIRVNMEHKLLLSNSRYSPDVYDLNEQVDKMIEDAFFEKKGAMESNSEYVPSDIELNNAEQKLGSWARINSKNLYRNLNIKKSDYPSSDDMDIKYKYAYLIDLNDMILAQMLPLTNFEGFNYFEIRFVVDQINTLLKGNTNLSFDEAARLVLGKIDTTPEKMKEYSNLISVIRGAYPNPSGKHKQIKLKGSETLNKNHWEM